MEQADIIFKIINEIPEDPDQRKKDMGFNYRTKNVFSWRKDGGTQLLDNLDEEESDFDAVVDVKDMTESER